MHGWHHALARRAGQELTRDPLGPLVAMAAAAGDPGKAAALAQFYEEKMMTRMPVTDAKALACDRDSGDSLERGATPQRAIDVFNHVSF
jgi:hypothetical protein